MSSIPGSVLPKKPAKVALLVPLTGTHASLGQAMLSAAQLALFDVGSENFELLPRDTGMSPQTAAQAAQSALADGAHIILGPVFADAVKAVKPIAQNGRINMVAFSNDVSAAGGNTYLLGITPQTQIDRMVQYAARKGIKNAAIISGVDAYADMATREFQNSAQRHGITITETLRYNSKSMPSAEAIKKLGGSNIQGVFLPMDGISAGVVAGLLPKTIQKMGTGLWDDPRTLSHPALDGAWFSAPSPRQFSVFEKKYRMTYGNTPPRLASLAYDATALAAVLTRSGKGFGADAITGVNGFSGMDGIFRFDQNGLAERGLAIMEIRQGQAQEIDPAPTTFQRP